MTTLTFILELAGATMLLLYAVKMVQTGIERALGPSFKRILTRAEGSRIANAGAGMVLAIILQSSTAAALLTVGLASSGVISLANGLAVMLGADLGSALVVQILSFRLDWLVPLLLALGGWMFLKLSARGPKQTGRILLGIAFILLSLRLIGEAAEPIRESAFLPVVAGFLAGDYISAFLLGAALAFVMHSSVAAILLCVTFVTLGVLPLQAGISLVLGANLGGALIAIWLTRGQDPAARRIPFGNLMLRGTGAVVALLVLNLLVPPLESGRIGAGQVLVFVHLGFNAAILLIWLPLLGLVEPLIAGLFSTRAPAPALGPVSALDRSLLTTPKLALGAVSREVLRMGQVVEVMTRPVMDLYQSGDAEQIAAVRAMDRQVNKAFTDIRRYTALMGRQELCKGDVRRLRDLSEYAINIETAGDIVAKRLLTLAEEKNRKGLKFSTAGWGELKRMHERLMTNIQLSYNVLLTSDSDLARVLFEEKGEMTMMERKSRKQHLKRLRGGEEVSFESSDIHLETLRGIKEINSLFASITYSILHREGQLHDSRLIEAVPARNRSSSDE